MRPRKAILLFCDNEQERSVLTMTLELRGYRVLGGISSLPPIPLMAIVVDDRSLSTAFMAKKIGATNPSMPIVVIPCGNYRRLFIGYPMYCELLPATWTPATLLARVRLTMVRKYKSKITGAPLELSVKQSNSLEVQPRTESHLIAGSSGPA